MTYAISDFSRGEFQYLSEDGNKYLMPERNVVHAAVVTAAPAAAMAAKDGTEVGFFRGNPRRAWFVSTTAVTPATGKAYYPKKEIVFQAAGRAALLAATLNMDGLEFVSTGRVEGEDNHR